MVECTLIKVFCLITSEAFPQDLGINLISVILYLDNARYALSHLIFTTLVSKQNRKYSYVKQVETRFNGPFET